MSRKALRARVKELEDENAGLKEIQDGLHQARDGLSDALIAEQDQHQTLVEACKKIKTGWDESSMPMIVDAIEDMLQALENTARDSSKDGKGWIEDPPPPIDTES